MQEEFFKGDLPQMENSPFQRDSVKRKEQSFLVVCVLLVLGILAFRIWWTSTYGGVVVEGYSMERTLQDGDKLFVRYASKGAKAERGDIIVVHTGVSSATGKANYVIKRLIATAGDKVRCQDGQVSVWYAGTEGYVNLSEPYAYYDKNQADYDFAEYTVEAGEIYFLGDNRNHSSDCHNTNRKYTTEDIYGVVPDWSIKYKAICKLFISDSKK